MTSNKVNFYNINIHLFIFSILSMQFGFHDTNRNDLLEWIRSVRFASHDTNSYLVPWNQIENLKSTDHSVYLRNTKSKSWKFSKKWYWPLLLFAFVLSCMGISFIYVHVPRTCVFGFDSVLQNQIYNQSITNPSNPININCPLSKLLVVNSTSFFGSRNCNIPPSISFVINQTRFVSTTGMPCFIQSLPVCQQDSFFPCSQKVERTIGFAIAFGLLVIVLMGSIVGCILLFFG
jgi:hypothetical protein